MSLKDGIATIQFTSGNRVRVPQVWKVVRDNGFTPRASSIRAEGVVAIRGDTVLFTVSGSDESFVVENAGSSGDRVAELRAARAGVRVRVEGDLPALGDKPGAGAVRLRLRTVTTL